VIGVYESYLPCSSWLMIYLHLSFMTSYAIVFDVVDACD